MITRSILKPAVSRHTQSWPLVSGPVNTRSEQGFGLSLYTGLALLYQTVSVYTIKPHVGQAKRRTCDKTEKSNWLKFLLAVTQFSPQQITREVKLFQPYHQKCLLSQTLDRGESKGSLWLCMCGFQYDATAHLKKNPKKRLFFWWGVGWAGVMQHFGVPLLSLQLKSTAVVHFKEEIFSNPALSLPASITLVRCSITFIHIVPVPGRWQRLRYSSWLFSTNAWCVCVLPVCNSGIWKRGKGVDLKKEKEGGWNKNSMNCEVKIEDRYEERQWDAKQHGKWGGKQRRRKNIQLCTVCVKF